MDSPIWPPIARSTPIGFTPIVTSTPTVATTIASPSTETPTEKINSLNAPNADLGSQRFVHNQTHFQGPPRGDCIYCHGTWVENELDSPQDFNAGIEREGEETEMSQESSQASGEDMSSGESSFTNTSITTISSYQSEETLNNRIRATIHTVNNSPRLPRASAKPAVVGFPLPPECVQNLAHTSRLQSDLIGQLNRDIVNYRLEIADLKYELKIGVGGAREATERATGTNGLDPTSQVFVPKHRVLENGEVVKMGFSEVPEIELSLRLIPVLLEEARRSGTFSKRLDPTSQVFAMSWKTWVPGNGYSERALESLNGRLPMLIGEMERLKKERDMFKVMWKGRFQFAVLEEGYVAPDRKRHFDEFIRNQPKKA